MVSFQRPFEPIGASIQPNTCIRTKPSRLLFGMEQASVQAEGQGDGDRVLLSAQDNFESAHKQADVQTTLPVNADEISVESPRKSSASSEKPTDMAKLGQTFLALKGLTPQEAAARLQADGYQVAEKTEYGYHPIYAMPVSSRKRAVQKQPVGYIQYEEESDQDGIVLRAITVIPNPDVLLSSERRSNNKGTYWSVKNRTVGFPETDYISLVSLLPPEPMKPEVYQAIRDLKYLVTPHRVDKHTVIAELMDCNAQQLSIQAPLSLSAFEGVLKNLKTLHERGLIHRDLKAENFLMKNGVAKLGDLDSLAFRENLHHARPTLSMIDAASRHFYDKQDESFLEHLKKYGKVCDDYSALLALMEVTGHNKTAKAIAGDHMLYALKKKSKKEPDFIDKGLHIVSGVAAKRWINKYVLKAYKIPISKLLLDPVAYYAEYGDTLHLYDMLKLK